MATSILVVRIRVVRPLEDLNSAMLRLAENDLTAPLPRGSRTDEIGEMSDTLRVFKANALRRQRAQQDKQMLHGAAEGRLPAAPARISRPPRSFRLPSCRRQPRSWAMSGIAVCSGHRA